MPVFWFALSQSGTIDVFDSILVFFILHVLVYPSSNGYNSYMDRDTESIGGLEKPAQPTRQLFYTTIAMDVIALILSLFISIYFLLGIVIYIAASRAYSYRGIRLKKYPIGGYLTVVICQGALTFFLVMHGASEAKTLDVPSLGMIGAALLVGGFYPLTQIYQHSQDVSDGVITLSYKLGYKGTFFFTAIVYGAAMGVIGWYLSTKQQFDLFLILQIFLLPVLVYFAWWFLKVFNNNKAANFRNTMRMNLIGSLFTNAAFIYLFLIQSS